VKLLDYFSEVVIADSEFRPDGRGGQEVRCIAAKELRSQRVHRVWIDGPIVCPYPVGADALFVAHYASSELLSHQALGWPCPVHVLDSCIEYHAMTCGLRHKDQGRSLVDALVFLRLPHIAQTAKDEMRDLVLEDKRNYDFSVEERESILNYCESDVDGLAALLVYLEAYLCR
jgi:hypothetical protein